MWKEWVCAFFLHRWEVEVVGPDQYRVTCTRCGQETTRWPQTDLS